jgi:hypothetical protein
LQEPHWGAFRDGVAPNLAAAAAANAYHNAGHVLHTVREWLVAQKAAGFDEGNAATEGGVPGPADSAEESPQASGGCPCVMMVSMEGNPGSTAPGGRARGDVIQFYGVGISALNFIQWNAI